MVGKWMSGGAALAVSVGLVGVIAMPAGAVAPASAATTRVGTSVRRLAVVGTITPAVEREVRSLRSVRDLVTLPASTRRMVTTPAVEVVSWQRVPIGAASYSSGNSKVGRGCFDAWVSRSRKNVFGWVLMTAKTTIHNWCNDGRRITSSPTVVRSVNGHWGWSGCSWNNSYQGWLSGRTRYGAGGYAQFAFGDTCFSAQMQLRNEVQVQGNGRYYWWN
ncbi:MAG: hypothetical protein JWL83_306 [Actinomycetia bacterium]|nr:hypothetical protein [Actinomycetes bacterium]